MRSHSSSFDPLRAFRRRARFLHRDLFSDESATALGAAARLVRTRPARAVDVQAVHALRETVRRRDALDAVARETGHASWSALLEQANAIVAVGTVPAIDVDALFRGRGGGMTHGWFSTHAQGRRALTPDLFLLPYGEQAVLVDAAFLNALGLDAEDRDLRAVGNDWTARQDAEAWRRLAIRLALLGYAPGPPSPRRARPLRALTPAPA